MRRYSLRSLKLSEVVSESQESEYHSNSEQEVFELEPAQGGDLSNVVVNIGAKISRTQSGRHIALSMRALQSYKLSELFAARMMPKLCISTKEKFQCHIQLYRWSWLASQRLLVQRPAVQISL